MVNVKNRNNLILSKILLQCFVSIMRVEKRKLYYNNRKEMHTAYCYSKVFTNARNWQFWQKCQLSISVRCICSVLCTMQFCKCQMRCQRAQRDCISKLQTLLVFSIKNLNQGRQYWNSCVVESFVKNSIFDSNISVCWCYSSNTIKPILYFMLQGTQQYVIWSVSSSVFPLSWVSFPCTLRC